MRENELAARAKRLVSEDDLDGLVGVGACAFELREWDKSLVAARAAYQRDPTNPYALQCLGAVLGEFGRFEEQLVFLERAVSLAPSDPQIRVRLALRQLEEGDYEKGWRNYEARLEVFRMMGKPVNAPVPRWRGENLATKNIVIFNEPYFGLGDAVLFLRYIPVLAERARREGGLILLVIDEPLYPLFARTLVDYGREVFLTTISRGQPWQLEHLRGRTLRQTSLASLPLLLGETLQPKFPYLAINPVKAAAWRERLLGDPNLKIGLCWTGRPDHPRNDLRSVPLPDLVRALEGISGLSLYNLQCDQSLEAKKSGLIDFTDEFATADDTASLIGSLDLIIAIDCFIAHLSGALGVQTWVLSDLNPPWMWGREGSTSVWYPGIRIYRQRQMQSWLSVFQAVRCDLIDYRTTPKPWPTRDC